MHISIGDNLIKSISDHISQDLGIKFARPEKKKDEGLLDKLERTVATGATFVANEIVLKPENSFIDYNLKVLAYNTMTVLTVIFAARAVFAAFALASVSGPILGVQLANFGFSLASAYVAGDFRNHLEKQLDKAFIWKESIGSSNVGKVFKKVISLEVAKELQKVVDNRKNSSIVTQIFVGMLAANSALQKIFFQLKSQSAKG